MAIAKFASLGTHSFANLRVDLSTKGVRSTSIEHQTMWFPFFFSCTWLDDSKTWLNLNKAPEGGRGLTNAGKDSVTRKKAKGATLNPNRPEKAYTQPYCTHSKPLKRPIPLLQRSLCLEGFPGWSRRRKPTSADVLVRVTVSQPPPESRQG